MIELNNLTKEALPQTFLKRVAQSVLRQEKKSGAGISVVFTGKKRIAELNRIYRKKDKVANVLSFSFDAAQDRPFDDAPAFAKASAGRQSRPMSEFGLGEVVLCPAEIRKDARKYGIPYRKAMAWMLIHGILHLLGYTHSEMTNREKQYLTRFS